MWIFCFSICLTLLIDTNESIPSTTNAPLENPDHHGAFQIQQQNATTNTNDTEQIKQTENPNKTAPMEKTDNAKDPTVTNSDRQNSEDKREADKLAFEMFKIKCQHFQNLLRANRTNKPSYRPPSYQQTTPKPTNRPPSYQQATLQPTYRPPSYQQITPKPTYRPPNYQQATLQPTYRPSSGSTSRPNGFYVTLQSQSTKKPVVNVENSAPIKYIRLEPVILQKTTLSDGQTVYYWHRSLPTAVELPARPTETVKHEQAPPQDFYGYVPQTVNVPAPSSGQVLHGNSYYYPDLGLGSEVAEADKKPVETTTEPTTSTTEESYGYGFGNFLPFYSLTKGETTTSTTSRPTTTPAPSTDKVANDDLVYAQQLKFIIPVPYGGSQGSSPYGNPWDFDRYAYYPKELQPNTLNVRVPYSPTFHMIRAVAIPGLGGTDDDRIGQTSVDI